MDKWFSAIVKIGSTTFAPKTRCILDNILFKLHYKVTTAILLVSIVLLTGSLWFGRPISCIQRSQVPNELFENHCLVSGTRTIYATDWSPAKPNPYAIYPGILPSHDQDENSKEERRQPWYKWTPLILLAMAMSYYLPHHLWKLSEGGRINALRQDMDYRSILSEEESKAQRQKAVNWILNMQGQNKFYFAAFNVSEWLNVAINVGWIYLLNYIFDNQFLNLGLYGNVDLLFQKEDIPRYDYMEKLFPKVAQCQMNLFGTSGTVVNVTGICFLYHNYLNELLFVFLWYWLLGLALLTPFYLVIYRGCFCIKAFRKLTLQNICPPASTADIEIMVNKLSFSDWFIVKNLLWDVQPYLAHDLITDVADGLREKNRKTRGSNQTTTETTNFLEK